jgi:hypothetical protein
MLKFGASKMSRSGGSKPPPYTILATINDNLPWEFPYVQILIRIHPLPALFRFLYAAAMIRQQPHKVVHIDPYL